MKALFILIAVVMLPQLSWARIDSKEPLKADFNLMITNTATEKRDVADSLTSNLPDSKLSEDELLQTHPDEGKVTDFVDVEIGWGEAPKVVDRRFNSVGEATILN